MTWGERSAVAVVGMACRFPGADDVDGFWALVRDGRVATARVSPGRWRHEYLHRPDDPRHADSAYTDVVAHLSDVRTFDGQRYGLAPRRVEVTDPQQRLLVALTDAALRDAALPELPVERTGVYVGASVSEYRELLTSRLRAGQMAAGDLGEPLDPALAEAAVGGVVPMRAFTMAGSMLNMAAATVSSVFDLRGPSLVVDAACASSLLAVHEAVGHLRSGRCDLAVAGGVYLNLVPDNLVAFSRIGALSRSGVCRPFDRRADGFVLGEGAAVVLLKRLDDALRDGNRVHGVVRGVGCANDGRADGPMTPRLAGQVSALRHAYDDAGIEPSGIGFVECHGTATPTGDAVELAALRAVFGEDAEPYVSSVKANIGHAMSASGIAGLVKALLVLGHGVVPPQVGCEEPVPGLGALRLVGRPHPWPAAPDVPRRAAVNSFGFGGTNVHVVLEQGRPGALAARPAPIGGSGRALWAVTPGPDPGRGRPTPATGVPTPAHPPDDDLLAAIASVSDHPRDTLRAGQSLVADLGFDSLMLVELEEKLAQRYDLAGELPAELLGWGTTIADLHASLAARDRPPPSSGAGAGALPSSDAGAGALPELAALAHRRALLDELGLPNPYFVAHDGALGATTTVDGVELVDFSGYDYLGLATDPRVVAAAQRAVARFGTSVSASRVASGERPLHGELETELARLLGTEDALAMVSGYTTNLSVLGHLLGPDDLAVHDALAHDSIVHGIRLSGATRRRFPHNDLAALRRILDADAGRYRRVVVAVEGVYSMDGDLADLPELVRLRRRYGFLLYLDEAHSIGVLGRTGRGAGEHWQVEPTDVDLWMGTLSKALASCGGYVAGHAKLVDYLRYTTPGFVYSVGIPPAAAAAALAAVRVLTADTGPVARLHRNAALFRARATARGVRTGGAGTPIVPVVTGGSARTLRLGARMRERRINVQPIVYPAVPEAAGRLRFFVKAAHTADQIEAAVDALAAELGDTQ
ncbi:aminotransferase class I/II-fold pyridoxal phosphate-dependent enzyme [Plantactinospora sp. ZYX-F-223]|uniref:aminotransferase class I/II-fold pyridoxal phosphate-dependent enzyme n=1 Tax=Plantactinospora sp. ZYX-F-223 TaxID=3144103 RepID=UPI0031FC4FDE